MRGIWNEIRDHPVAWTSIAFLWLLLQGQYLPRLWHAPLSGPDPIRSVFGFHLLLPLAAGALFSWRHGRWRIIGGMVAGAVVLAFDFAFMIACGLVVSRFWERVSGDFGPVTIGNAGYVIEAGVIGLILGLAGALGRAGLASVVGGKERQKSAPG